VRRHYEIAVREQIERHFGSWRRPSGPTRSGRGFPGRSQRDRGRWNAEPTGPSQSLLSNPLVSERGRGGSADLALSDAVLIGTLLLHPEIASERLELLADSGLTGRPTAALANALASLMSENPGMSAAQLRSALQTAGHGRIVEAVLEKLLDSGLGRVIEASSERAASIWDDAAHLRLRSGALSIERKAAAQALGRETSELHLVRLRDIQEHDQRSLRPDDGESAGDTLIVHPFKRR
jgi:DNA primase